MIITLAVLIITVLIEVFTPFLAVANNLHLGALTALGGTVILLTGVYFQTSILIPLENLERKLVPNLLEVARKDTFFYWGRFLMFLFPILSYIFTLIIIELPLYQKWLFSGWLILFAIVLDFFRDGWERVANFLTPSYLVKHISQGAIKSIQIDEDDVLWNRLDDLSEIGLNAAEKGKLALSNQVLQTFPGIVQTFFDSSKSISRMNRDQEVKKMTGRDEANYTTYYLLQRLELINDKALQNRLETVCRQMIVTMGKIVISSARYDLTMVSFPTHFLTKFGLKAQQHHYDEVSVLAVSTLIEIAKTITTDINLEYTELKEPFKSILNGLDALAKGAFKKNKQINIKTLIQPFLDIREFFKTEKMARHPDTPVIEHEIDQLLAEYKTLEDMLQGIPSMPNI